MSLRALRSRQPVVVVLRGVLGPVHATVLAWTDEDVRLRIWGLRQREAVVPFRDVVSADVVRVTYEDVRRISAEQRGRCGKELGPWLE